MLDLVSPCHVALLEDSAATFASAVKRAASVTDNAAGFTWLEDCSPHDLYEVIDGVAIVSVLGVLVDELEFHGSSWITGYNGIRAAVAAAAMDPSVKIIVLYVDSPGGMVSGCFELTEYLRSVRANTPLMAIVKDMAASAAYAIAAQAEVISVPRTGAVGSIGVYRMHVSYAGLLAKEGIEITFSKAGGYKTDGNPYEPLGEDVKNRWDAVTESFRQIFAEEVALGRAINKADVLSTEAELFDGPDNLSRAMEAGLVDFILSPDTAFQRLSAVSGDLT